MQVMFYALNYYVCVWNLKVSDIGGSMIIHSKPVIARLPLTRSVIRVPHTLISIAELIVDIATSNSLLCLRCTHLYLMLIMQRSGRTLVSAALG